MQGARRRRRTWSVASSEFPDALHVYGHMLFDREDIDYEHLDRSKNPSDILTKGLG